MKYCFTSILILLFNLFFGQVNIDLKKQSDLSIGECLEIHSKVLNEDRKLNIYLPYGYSPDSAKTYPIIYLLDGSIDEDFLHISGLVQFGSFPWVKMLPESIVVGISNIDRERDFTFPTSIEKDQIDFPTSGKSSLFIQFIKNELQPFIESQYKTDTIKTIIGQSLGGLLTTEILFTYPDLFDNYIIVSPSLWWNNESLLKITPVSSTKRKKIYISVGAEGKFMVNPAKALSKLCYEFKNAETHFEYFEDKNHANALHQSVYNAFYFISE